MSLGRTGESNVVISSLGMVSPCGHNVDQSCATVRAGISRLSESSEFLIANQKGHRAPVLCGVVAGITNGQRRFLRHLRMAIPACKEALEKSAITQEGLTQSGLYLCLQEVDRPGMDNRPEQILAKRLARELNLGDLASRTQVFNMGHAGVFYALQMAIRDLVNGKYNYAIIGAVDTYLDEITLEWLQDMKRIKTDDNNKGFIPGEAAGFLVLERQETATRRGIKSLARLQAPSTATEPNSIYHDDPCQGQGLSTCIQNTFSVLEDGGRQTGLVVCDLNGERYRSLEWGLALPRSLSNVQVDIHVVHPADCMGDTGAASGIANICYTTMMINKNYTGLLNGLVWGSSDDGERGSVYLRAV